MFFPHLEESIEQAWVALALTTRQRFRSHLLATTRRQGLPVRPRWRTMATPREVEALVDAGVEYVKGTLWLWEARTPSRLIQIFGFYSFVWCSAFGSQDDALVTVSS